jgi:glycyl-tRNA synthetase beta chain
LDRSRRLESWREALNQVTVHAKLGTYGDKIDRMRRLFEATRDDWVGVGVDESLFLRAVDLYKCDLLTHVVQEFPELQGEMGAIYADLDGEAREVVAAIRDQYRPSRIDDALPEGPLAQALGLLDRLETLLVAYAQGLKPTGSEDPYGLRRALLGVARIAAQTPVLGQRPLGRCVNALSDALQLGREVADAVYQHAVARMESVLEPLALPTEVVRAVLSHPDLVWTEIYPLVHWLADVAAQPPFAAALAAYKRMKRVGGANLGRSQEFCPDQADARELSLYAVFGRLTQAADREQWWAELTQSLPAIDQFFVDVLVMDPDDRVRRRRLALMAVGLAAFNRYFVWDQFLGGEKR